MLMDIMFIKSPREKNKLYFYLNDNNLYVKNSLKLRKKHLSYFKEKIDERNRLKKEYPVPKVLYSTSDANFNQTERKKELIEKLSPKNDIKDLMDMMNDFTHNLKFDDLDEKNEVNNIEGEKDEEKIKKKNSLSLDNDKKKKLKIKILNDNKSGILKNETGKKYKEFFLTNNGLNNKHKIKSKSKVELLNDLEYAKPKNVFDPAISSNQAKNILNQKKMFKTNLYFENYGKYKFTKKGVLYPKTLGEYELPKYEGNNEEEKKYFNFRKEISNPKLTYNRITNFSEKFNRDLGEISNNYGNNLSRTRFTENPLMKKYMEIIPVYEIYKDIKQIENRYIGTKYKFKLLPLYNKRISNLDKIADKFYKNQKNREELKSLLKIQSSNYLNKNKKIN